MKCVQYQQWISLFLSLQVHPDGLWRPPGPVSVGGECGHDLVRRQDAGCRPGATSSPDAPHTQDDVVWRRTHPESSSHTLTVHWGTDTLLREGLPDTLGNTSRWVNQDALWRKNMQAEKNVPVSWKSDSFEDFPPGGLWKLWSQWLPSEDPAVIFQFTLFRHQILNCSLLEPVLLASDEFDSSWSGGFPTCLVLWETKNGTGPRPPHKAAVKKILYIRRVDGDGFSLRPADRELDRNNTWLILRLKGFTTYHDDVITLCYHFTGFCLVIL